ncbi:hypothetical protein D5R81_15365 [Parashewanella spongiae]|uniref:Ankyrin repeat domain-containing protein n=1 Tax=Parashewanella spongiae TaxID=342950 RepID=A0A3A6TGD7_9GAMM|nr:hypothetical protein [Parashewanella spongiae]MCL1079425.1 hypothetical protein [Parashewanella spongiae]RJY07683.1 hypothetical protein D5R81_15365 [Parashewanella spongiae]
MAVDSTSRSRSQDSPSSYVDLELRTPEKPSGLQRLESKSDEVAEAPCQSIELDENVVHPENLSGSSSAIKSKMLAKEGTSNGIDGIKDAIKNHKIEIISDLLEKLSLPLNQLAKAVDNILADFMSTDFEYEISVAIEFFIKSEIPFNHSLYLYTACHLSLFKLADSLLMSNNIDPNYEYEGRKLILVASDNQLFNVIAFLLEKPNLDLSADDTKQLMKLAYTNKWTKVFVLLEKQPEFDLNTVDARGNNYLQYLLSTCEMKMALDVVRQLKTGQKKIDLNWQNNAGETSLMMIIKIEKIELIHEFINVYGIDYTLEAKNGDTAQKLASAARNHFIHFLISQKSV